MLRATEKYYERRTACRLIPGFFLPRTWLLTGLFSTIASELWLSMSLKVVQPESAAER